ncbi:MAG TPA: hypothetical protein VGO55_00335 [Allosphingosinicella sp.]|nr:hypothetical protein [Allosphingosinicella sp.]
MSVERQAGERSGPTAFPVEEAAPIGRRALLLGSVAGLGALAASPAEACSFISDRRTPFDEAACRRALDNWVALLNAGPELTLEVVTERVDAMSPFYVDGEMVQSVLGDRSETLTGGQYVFHKEFRLAGGRPDPRPIRVAETHHIRRLRNRATHQFTLERYSYVPEEVADGGSCDISHEAYYGTFRTSYLATFHNNRLGSIRLFPEWYLEQRST